ncbi:MAG: hypothetical protein WCI11_16710 [Candidatus Methylumidiphilus sp.]
MLSAACNYAADELGWDAPNPATGKKVQEPEGRVRWIEREEAVRLIHAAVGIKRASWLVDFIQLALNTGCRMGEPFGWLVMEGIPLMEVGDTLGHSTVKMTERYAHLSPENVRAAVGRIQGVSRSCHVSETLLVDERVKSLK